LVRWETCTNSWLPNGLMTPTGVGAVIDWLVDTPQQTDIPRQCDTVRGTVAPLLALNPKKVAARWGAKEATWSVLCSVIRDELRVKESQIKFDSRFKEDLRID
jgi:hypothetical protein